jgi:hypothetical protein
MIKFEDKHHKQSEGLLTLIIHCGPEAEQQLKLLKKEKTKISQLMGMQMNQQFQKNKI